MGEEEAHTGGAPRCCRISGPKTTGNVQTASADREEWRRWTADAGRRLVVFHRKRLHNVSRRTSARPAASVLSRMLSPLNARADPFGLKQRWGQAARGPRRRHTGGPLLLVAPRHGHCGHETRFLPRPLRRAGVRIRQRDLKNLVTEIRDVAIVVEVAEAIGGRSPAVSAVRLSASAPVGVVGVPVFLDVP